MSKIAIVTDSSAYLPKAFVDQHNIRVVPLKIHWNEKTYRDGIDISPSAYYKLLSRSSTIPTTSQPSVDEFLQIYEELAADHDGIIVPVISSGISGTYSSAKTAASMFSEVPVEVVDTLTTAAGLALVDIAVAQAVSEGKDLAAVKKLAEGIVNRLGMYFVVDTLKYLHKGGRIGGASRYFGTALSIKPVLYLDRQGKIDALDRVRTKTKALAKLVELAVAKAAGQSAHIGIIHADALDEAKQIKAQLSDQINCKQIEIYDFSPAIGTHVGPGTVGVGIYPET